MGSANHQLHAENDSQRRDNHLDHPKTLNRTGRAQKEKQTETPTAAMHLMYTLDSEGKRLYTLKKVAHGQVTKSAHPARFSPDDKWSRQRVTLKRRFGLLLTQQKEAQQ